jgi:Spy/CpxP family protein refolding chaperone
VTVLALIVSAAIIGTGAAAPAAEPARMVIQLLDRLDLSSDQISSLRAVASRHRPAISSLVEREIETRAALREAIRRTPVDEAAIANAADAVAAVDQEFANARASFFVEAAPILTDTQRAELEAFISEVQPLVVARLHAASEPTLLLRRLNLSEQSEKAAAAVLASHRDAIASRGASVLEAHADLGRSIRQAAVDKAAVQRASEHLAACQKELALERGRTYAAMASALTEDERIKLDAALLRLDRAVTSRVRLACDIANRVL